MKYARTEYKYLLPLEIFDEIRNDIFPFVRLDSYCKIRPQKEYTVRSVYYDNSELKCYNERISGIFGRKKIRIRGYNELQNPLNLFLEIKQKTGATISKTRHKYCFRYEHFFLKERSTLEHLRFLESQDETEALPPFINLVKRFHFVPIVSVIYEREAFLFKFDQHLRITFDKNLRSRLTNTPFNLFQDNNLVPVLRKYMILEIKSNNPIPLWLRKLISKYELRQQALSKYTMSLDANKMNRLYFSTV